MPVYARFVPVRRNGGYKSDIVGCKAAKASSPNNMGENMTDQYHANIFALISEKGPMGVNALARELNTPVSNMQRYLHKQKYFRMNDNKKWDLPNNVMGDIKNTSLVLAADVLESSVMLLRTQLEEMSQYIENVINPLNTIKRGVKAFGPAAGAVADKSDISNEYMLYVDNEIQTLMKATKKYVGVCPEEYQEMLMNVDWYHLVMDLGFKYVKEYISPELGDLFLEKTDKLSEDTIDVLKEYQKNK